MNKLPHPTLHIVGGAEDRTGNLTVLRAFTQPDTPAAARRIAVIPTASGIPHEVADAYRTAFARLEAETVVINPTNTREADQFDLSQQLASCDRIWFTGGNQAKLADTLGTSRLADTIRQKYQNGTPVGGTSAGAAVLSYHMIVGGEPRLEPEPGIVDLEYGLGLLRHGIVDQHFTERRRLGRLIQATLDTNVTFGLGVDENTSAIVTQRKYEWDVHVVGAGNATIVTNHNGTTQLDVLPSGYQGPLLPANAAAEH